MQTAHSTKPKPNRTRLSPEARRAQLLDMAVSAFAASGIERAVHADVAALAGVSTPTVFKYFPTREALVSAVLDRIEVTITDLMLHVPDGAGLSAGEMAGRLEVALDNLCTKQPDLMKVVLAWSVAFSSVRERYVIFQQSKIDMFHARIAHTGADRTDSRILLGMALSYIRMNFDGSSEDVKRRFANRLIQLLEASPLESAAKD